MKRSVLLSIIGLFLFTNYFVDGHAQTTRDHQYKFSIDVPMQWSKSSKMDGTDKVYDFYSPDEMAAVQLRTLKAVPGLSLELLIQAFEQNYLPAGYHKESLQDKISENGIPGKQGIYNAAYNGNKLGLSSFYTIQNGYAYVLTAYIAMPSLEKWGNEVKKITKSFVIDGFQKNQPQRLAHSNHHNQITHSKQPPFMIENVLLSDQVDQYNKAINPKSNFSTSTPEIFAAMTYSGGMNAEFTIKWIYKDWNREISKTTYTINDQNGTTALSLTKPNTGWPAGNYAVQIEKDGRTLRSIPFFVKKSGPIISQQSSGLSSISVSGNTGSIIGKYNFISRSDGKKLVNYHYIEIRKDGAYSERYQPKHSPNYSGGQDGTWKLIGNTLTLTQNGGVSDSYQVNGDILIRTSSDGTQFTFRK